MSQNDFNIANQGFPATRADINSALQALASTSAGTTEPGTTYAYQMWYDETADLLKMRNSGNDAWITLAAFDQTADEWELRSAVIQAVDSAGVVIKTDDGTTRVTVADSGNVTLANDLVVTGTVQASNISATGSMAARNKIINGGMVIDQRNAGAAVTFDTVATYLVDRWTQNNGGGATITGQQSTTAPSGFRNSLLVTATTGGAPSAGHIRVFRQMIEGFNTADLGWGSASAQPIAVSFWVRSSATGTFCCYVCNAAYNRSQVQTFSISSANTWEYKTISFSGDTTGTWGTGNGVGIEFGFDVGSGSDRETTAGVWNAGFYNRTSGAVILSATTNANIYLTGVQLEVGDTATPFEHRSYGQELALCQRYFWKTSSQQGIWSGNMTSGVSYYMNLTHIVPMRATPSIVDNSSSGSNFGAASWFTLNSQASQATAVASATGSSGYFYFGALFNAEL